MKLRVGFGSSPTKIAPLKWAIELIGGTPFSHTFNVLVDSNQIFQVTIDQNAGVIPAASFVYNVYAEYEFELTDDQFKKVTAFMAKWNGTPYSYGQLFGAALAQIFRLKKNPINHSDSGATCTKLLLLLMQGLPEVFTGIQRIKCDPHVVGLKVLYDFVSDHPNARKV